MEAKPDVKPEAKESIAAKPEAKPAVKPAAPRDMRIRLGDCVLYEYKHWKVVVKGGSVIKLAREQKDTPITVQRHDLCKLSEEDTFKTNMIYYGIQFIPKDEIEKLKFSECRDLMDYNRDYGDDDDDIGVVPKINIKENRYVYHARYTYLILNHHRDAAQMTWFARDADHDFHINVNFKDKILVCGNLFSSFNEDKTWYIIIDAQLQTVHILGKKDGNQVMIVEDIGLICGIWNTHLNIDKNLRLFANVFDGDIFSVGRRINYFMKSCSYYNDYNYSHDVKFNFEKFVVPFQFGNRSPGLSLLARSVFDHDDDECLLRPHYENFYSKNIDITIRRCAICGGLVYKNDGHAKIDDKYLCKADLVKIDAAPISTEEKAIECSVCV